MRTRVSLATLWALLALILSACTSTQSVLEPSALTSPTGATGQRGDVRLYFAPVIGASAEATQPLSARLAQRARELGIGITREDDASGLMMKGYFSAITEGGGTTVIFVWDVVDASGNRLHRIQGQQAAQPAPGQGWNSVDARTMEQIADETMTQLLAWLATRQAG